MESTGLKSEYSIIKQHRKPFNGSKKGSLKGDYKGSRKEPFKDWILDNVRW